jgi:4-amino-4-deoxy-L-arabinose transferase-like glycosyltransferase
VASSARQALHPALAPVAVMVVALVLRLPILTDGQIDYDEGVYWQSLRALMAGHHLFSEIYSSQPPGFLLALLPFFGLLGQNLIAARIGVLLFSLAGLLAAYRIGSLLADRRVGLLAMAVLAADPISLRESVALQADSPAIALALWSVALALETRATGRRSALLAFLAGGLLALGVLVKPLAVAAGPPLLLALLLSPAAGRDRLRGLVLAAAGGIVASAALLLPLHAEWGPMWEQTVGFHLVARGVSVGGLDLYTVKSELPLLALGLAGLAVCIRQAPRLAAVTGLWAASAALILAVQRPLWPHHLLALSVPAALLAGGLARLPALRSFDARLAVVPAALLLAASLGAAALVHQHQMSDGSLRPAVARLQAVTRPSEPIVTDDQYLAALAGRDTPPELVDTSMVRLGSGDLTAQSIETISERSKSRAFLFSTGRFLQLAGLQSWVAARYPHHEALDPQRMLYLP